MGCSAPFRVLLPFLPPGRQVLKQSLGFIDILELWIRGTQLIKSTKLLYNLKKSKIGNEVVLSIQVRDAQPVVE